MFYSFYVKPRIDLNDDQGVYKTCCSIRWYSNAQRKV